MRVIQLIIIAMSVLLSSCQQHNHKHSAYQSPNLKGQEQVCQFLKACETYYIATDDGGQPRVRPFGTINIFEGKLYIQTGHSKKVAKQIAANPRVEICAFNGKEWIRVSGKLVDDERVEAKVAMLDAYPSLKAMYDANDPNTAVFYITEAVATIESFSSEKVEIKF